MSGSVKHKWRPPLAIVIGGTLAAILTLPIIGLTYLRLAGNILGWLETAQLIGAISVVVTLVLGLLLWRLVLRPVWAVTAHARAMKAGFSDTPPPQRFGTSELGHLGRSVIEMGEALNGRARSLSAYADHVTHELKSPLTSLRGAADLLRDETLSPQDREDLLGTIETSALRMERLLNDLRRHAEVRMSTEPGMCKVQDALALADVPEALEIITDTHVSLPMSDQDFARVLTQMMRNAAEHGATKVQILNEGPALIITDNGDGVDTGNRQRIFDPFFTTRRDSGGTGMGLSICRTLIEAAGGRIEIENHSGGAKFRLTY